MRSRKHFRRKIQRAARYLCVPVFLLGPASIAQEASDDQSAIDPIASNNGMFPRPGEYDRGYFNESNLDYPTERPRAMWQIGGGLDGPVTKETAAQYMEAIKEVLELDMRVLIEDHEAWNAKDAGWFNMVWRGAGQPGKPENPISGREVIMNTNTGQIVPNESWAENYRPTPDWVQNYGVIYYNATAAFTLGQVFEDVFKPDPTKMEFPDGSIVVKVEAATVQPDEWPWADLGPGGSVLGDAAMWNVYRPTTENQKDHQRDQDEVPLKNVVQSVYPFQLAIKVKDSFASPETGWVYMGFVYDARSDGEGAWDRFVPAGMMWGNDPAFAETREGVPPFGGALNETWINPDAPPFVADTIGWGGRFAAPMDVAVRHGVEFPVGAVEDPPGDGFRTSSCLSCHGVAQTPYTDNLYPSPFPEFPADGDPFPLYNPGSKDWARWFQNRPGTVPQSGVEGVVALDYDLSSMIALEIARGSSSLESTILGILNGH